MIERVRLQVQASEMRFLQKIKGVTLLTRCTSLESKVSRAATSSNSNLLQDLLQDQSSSNLLQDLSLDGLAKSAECIRKKPNKLYLSKQMGKKQLDDPELL